MKTFTLTEEHVKLLRAAWVTWDDCEFGAPQIDPKRPYGNTSVVHDIAEELGIDLNPEEEVPSDIEDELTALHAETEEALQVVLATGSFEPGDYEADDYNKNWRRAS